MQRWLLALTLAGALAFFGGWYSWTTVPLFFATVIVALSRRQRTFSFPRDLRLLDSALLVAAIAIAIQLVPLPQAVAGALSPNAARLRGTLRLDAITLSDGWIPLSVDPRATLEALLIFLATVLVFWSARAAFATGGLRRFCRIVALLGLAFSIEAIIQ